MVLLALTMSALSHAFFLVTGLLFALLNLRPVSCIDKSLLSSPEGMLMEDKIRLGSTPPSCHNRCRQCNPCTAVQVPTLPIGPGSRTAAAVAAAAAAAAPSSYSKQYYSDYKPLGWKCRCGSRLYDP